MSTIDAAVRGIEQAGELMQDQADEGIAPLGEHPVHLPAGQPVGGGLLDQRDQYVFPGDDTRPTPRITGRETMPASAQFSSRCTKILMAAAT